MQDENFVRIFKRQIDTHFIRRTKWKLNFLNFGKFPGTIITFQKTMIRLGIVKRLIVKGRSQEQLNIP